MDLKTIRNSFHQQSLNHRNVDILINSDNFSIAFNNATKQEKKEISKAVERSDKKFLQNFTIKKLQVMTPFHRLGMRALREIGRNISLPNYTTLSKSSLIEGIQDVAERLKKSS